MKNTPVFKPCSGRKWTLEIRTGDQRETIRLTPPEAQTVTDEVHEGMEPYNEKAAPWRRTRLKKMIAQECASAGLLVPGSAVVRNEKGKIFREGKDYLIQESFNTFMMTEKSSIKEGETLLISYQFVPLRLDSIVRTAQGSLEQRCGTPHVTTPAQPALKQGEKRLANIFFHGAACRKLTEEMIFPVVKRSLPKSEPQADLLPRTVKKLKSGKKLRILVWGDSVTECAYLPEEDKYQLQFLAMLKKKYPGSDIEMRTFGWGGRNTGSFLAEPPGSPYNYAEQLLAWKPDLVISEFVNDGWMDEAAVYERYGKVRDDLKKIGAEWIILTPHYIKPDWMGLSSCKNCTEDPRKYVQAIRKFCKEYRIALAEGSKKYSHLWLTGIPHMTFMVNAINHPNRKGLKFFADALMETLREK